MGWGSKAIEIRAVESGTLDGVFMHKRTQKLRFLCERNDKVHIIITPGKLIFWSISQFLPWLVCKNVAINDKFFDEILLYPSSLPISPSPSLSLLFFQVFFASIRTSSSSQVYFMALNRRVVPQ